MERYSHTWASWLYRNWPTSHRGNGSKGKESIVLEGFFKCFSPRDIDRGGESLFQNWAFLSFRFGAAVGSMIRGENRPPFAHMCRRTLRSGASSSSSSLPPPPPPPLFLLLLLLPFVPLLLLRHFLLFGWFATFHSAALSSSSFSSSSPRFREMDEDQMELAGNRPKGEGKDKRRGRRRRRGLLPRMEKELDRDILGSVPFSLDAERPLPLLDTPLNVWMIMSQPTLLI